MSIPEHVSKLQLPEGVTSLYVNRCDDTILKRHNLHRHYGAPHRLTNLRADQQAHYQPERYVPFLAYADAIIFAYDRQQQGFSSFYLEGGVQDALDSTHWEGLFITEILRWWEADIADEDILHIGAYFGLRHTALVLESIYSKTDGEGFSSLADIAEWKKEVLQRM